MKKMGYVTLVYGLIILIGGWMGHIKSASRASLIAGLSFGVLLILSSIALFKGKRLGVFSAFLFTGILDGFFTYRFTLTRTWAPSGVMCLISIATFLILALLYRAQIASKRFPN